MQFRSQSIALVALLAAANAYAWERVTTRSGETFEGDATFQEIVFVDGSGEVVMPRAAILRIEYNDSGRLVSHIKDGTRVAGELKGLLEIEDGLIRRRFAGSDIARVEFDLFIDPSSRKAFSSCPIRFELDQSMLLSEPEKAWNTTVTSRVRCRDLHLQSLRSILRQSGSGRKGFRRDRPATLEVDTMLGVPPGHDQLVDFSVLFTQGAKVIARSSYRGVVDEAKNVSVLFKIPVVSGTVDPRQPLVMRAQIVHQDEREKIEKGGFFWWFTISLPI